MRIVYKNKYVDFEAPIFMSEEQRKKFITFMTKLFPNKVVVTDTAEKKKLVGNREAVSKNWTAEDLFLLLGSEDNQYISDTLGRSKMSIIMKRGTFVPDFMVWAKKKGYAVTQNKKMLKEFLNETR
jgi:hypothetical protein